MSSTTARSHRWRSAALAVPLMAVLLTGCGDDDDSSSAAPDDTSSETGGADATAEDATIDIVSIADGFDPATISVAAGSEVTWTNTDDTRHTSTAEDGTWDSGNLDGGGEFSFTVMEPGTYAYACSIHPAMTGELVVE